MSDALARAEAIRDHLGTAWELLIVAYREGDAIELGYSSWPEYLAGEFPVRPQLARADRPELFGRMQEAGMSQREIAAAAGVDHATVSRSTSGANAPVDDLDEPADEPDIDTPAPFVEPWEPSPLADPFAHWSQNERDLLEQLRAGAIVVVNMRAEAHGSLWAWAEQAGLAVRIDRKGPWGNPFVTPDDGTRDEVCDRFADHYWPHKPSLHKQLGTLPGKALGCWCAPARCHGDFLAEQATR